MRSNNQLGDHMKYIWISKGTWVTGISTYKETADWCKSKVSLEGIEGQLTHMNIISKTTYLEGLSKSMKHKFDSIFNY